MHATFNAMTGQLVQPGSPVFFLVLIAIGIGFYLWSKKNHPAYERLEDAVKRELADVKASVGSSFPKFVAEIEADVAKVQAKIDAFRNS
jgi:hypothetical protein